MASTTPEIKKRKPELEKLIIGPLMVLGEMTSGGHYMEMVKIIKQASGRSYPAIMKDLWVHEGVLGFYKGFLPWGSIQITKGIPVLFIQAEVDYRMKKMGASNDAAAIAGGVLGGVGQGVFMTPTQRLKTIVMTDPKYQGENAPKSVGAALRSTTTVCVDVVKSDGLGTLFKGLGPMCAKRGVDWGVRFTGMQIATNYFNQGKSKDRKLPMHEKLAAGFFAGALSTVTMPLDSLVANCQKASKAGSSGSAIVVAKEMWTQNGVAAFTRGWAMRIVHAGYHTMWMVAIGQFVFDSIRARKTEQQK